MHQIPSHNTRPETYAATTKTFQKRLQERKYPNKLTGKLISKVKFSERQQHLKKCHTLSIRSTPMPPLFKCHPPPQFNHLRSVILQQYSKIDHLVSRPRFVSLALPTLKKLLIRAEVKPTVEQEFDMLLRFEKSPENTTHVTAGSLPTLTETRKPMITPCNNPKCNTCTHLNCSPFFVSSTTKQRYPIRYQATCTSSNIVYLITCTKCKKQYVGLTTKQLNTRINHHRSNIFQNKTIYLCINFNFPDHNIKNLSVQVIDKTHKNTQTPLQDLQQLVESTL